MAKKLNTVNGIQGQDVTANASVKTTCKRRGKAKDAAVQSHAHVDEYTRKLEIGKAKSAQKAADYKVMCDRLDRAYDTYAKHMADAFGEGVRTMMRNTATVNGNDYDAAAAKEREFVAAANGREVARALHMADEYSVSAAAADSTVKVAAKKTAAKKSTTKKTTEKKTAEKKTAAPVEKKTAPVANDDLAALEALRKSGIISDYMFKKLAAKITAESESTAAAAPVKEDTAPRRYAKKTAAKKYTRKVEMTNVRTVTAKNGVEYTVGDFTHTQTGEKLYGVWMESKTDDGVKWLKDTFGVHYSPFAMAFVFSYKPDTSLKSGKAKKTAAKKSA